MKPHIGLSFIRRFLAWGLLLAVAAAALPAWGAKPKGKAARLDAPTRKQLEFFEKKIRPVLVAKCYQCHSARAKEVQGGLLLDTREGIRGTGDTGHAVVPSNPEESLLLKAIRRESLEMPPDEELPEAVIANFEKWIKMGAPDPRDGKARLAKTEPDWKTAKNFWAFQPPKKTPPPAVRDAAWPRGALDRFLLAAMEARGLRPVADADRPALLRRVSFDLIGLPPTPEELEAFVNDRSPHAFEKVVDRLLASPRFGERWGRHWLDVARYAESSGGERNFAYPYAWRYRDYVIAAFNADKPYDQFIREQIAGDLLPAKSAADRNENLTATGFLAIGPKSLNEPKDEQFRADVVDEQIDATTRAVMALTVSCARCHDHKFDPIPTRDYYAMAGIFQSTRTYYGTEAIRGNRQPSAVLPLLREGDSPGDAITPVRLETANPKLYAKNKAKKKRRRRKGEPRVETVRKSRSEHDLSGYAMGVLEGEPTDAPIYIRGEIDNQGDRVPRGFVTVVSGDAPPKIDPDHSGRLALADWLARRDNPLTARVAVNRIWLHLFGEGIVATPDNFGATGERPTHPALLDYLAVEFMDEGWSVKRMIRKIVLSRAYQLAGQYDAEDYALDPDNTLLWRTPRRRLDAEAIRDAILAIGGGLNRKPPVGSPVMELGGVNVGRGGRLRQFEDLAARRSVYLPILRDAVPDVLELFDFAAPSLVIGDRAATNVPAQALFLLNSPLVIEQSRHFALRLRERSTGTAADRIREAYLYALSREPTDAELARAARYLQRSRDELNLRPGEAWATFCQTLFACAEFRYLQ